MDHDRLTAVDADECQAAQNLRGLEPSRELLFNPQAVHEGQDLRLRPDARTDQRLGRIDGCRLERTDHQIDDTDLAGVTERLGGQMKIAVTAMDRQPVAPDGLQITPHQKAYVVPGPREPRTVQTSHRSGAADSNP